MSAHLSASTVVPVKAQVADAAPKLQRVAEADQDPRTLRSYGMDDDVAILRIQPDMTVRVLDVDGIGAFEVPFSSAVTTVRELRNYVVKAGNHGEKFGYRLKSTVDGREVCQQSLVKDITGVLATTSNPLDDTTVPVQKSSTDRPPTHCPLQLFMMPHQRHSMTIAIHTLTGLSTKICVDPHDTIERVKALIEEEEGFPAIRQHLTFGGKQLEEGRTLADYNVPNESFFHLVLLLPQQ